MLALPALLTFLELIYCCLDLRAKVCAMEFGLIDNVLTVCAIPSQPIYRLLRSVLL